MTNFYSWSYYRNSIPHWQSDTMYGLLYIDSASCSIDATSIHFRVAVLDSLPDIIFARQDWTLQIKGDNNVLHSEEMFIEKPTRGFAKSRGDHISFQVDPFNPMESKASDYIILKNTGNVPLRLSVSYDALDQYLEFTEEFDIIPPFTSQPLHITLNAPSWQPQKIEKSGVAMARVPSSHIVDDLTSGSSVSLQTALVIDPPPIHIFVGHSTHILETLNEDTGLTFQYIKSITVEEGEQKTLQAYISGEGTATVTLSVNEYLDLTSIRLNGDEIQNTFTVQSTSNKEQIISFDIQPISENKDGIIYYTIDNEGSTQTFSTSVQVIMPIVEDDQVIMQETSVITVIVLIVLICVGGYMLYNHLALGEKYK